MKEKLHRLTSFLILFLLCSTTKIFAQAPTDLFISEYVEGSSNNKAIEIFNGTGSPIDLTAGNYVLQMYFNGNTTANITISLTGTLANQDVYVLAHGAATFIAANGGFLTPDFTSTATAGWFNGDDAIVLRKGGAAGTIVDVIGQVGFDPGTEWGTGVTSTENNTLRRKAGDCSGDGNSSDAFDPSVKFDGFAQDTFTGLGTHSSTCVGGTSIILNAVSLSFTTPVGTPSGEQLYTVRGNSLTDDITIGVPPLSSFGLSTVPGGPYTGNIVIPFAAANAAPVTVYVIFNPAAAGLQSGNITHVSGTASANLPVQGTGTSGSVTPVYAIQGNGSASALDGTIVTTEGVVTADFQGAGQIGAFFIQDTSGDGNTATSDGIYVFNTSFAVNVGDYVRLTGEVDEFFSKTELTNIGSLTVLSSGNALPAAISINLPVAAITDLEKYEGMRVSFPQTLTVTETFTLARFGEVALSAEGRVFNPTNFVDPNDNPASGTNSTGTGNVAAVTAQQSLNDRRRILLDDASNVQNPAIVPYLNPADTTLRCGSTLADLTGIMDYDFSVYRIQPTVTPAFNYAARPAVPSVGAASVKVASFNVLNYFNGNGSGGGFPTSRGAHTLVEFNRQRAKIIAAIKELNADIVGLIEIENDGSGATSAIADLVNGLNAATAPGTYAIIADPTGANGNTGTDEIKQAIIYKPGSVTPVGLAFSDVNAAHNRPPVAQTFTANSNGEKLTVVVTHFKSKSSTGASGANVDQGDGQGAFNFARKQQATAFLAFIATIQSTTGDDDVIAVGDYNAYEQEDPMDILAAGGLINVLPNTYSYVFEGQSGSLDHALVTASLSAKISGADKWHINADEPIAKDYNQEFNPAYLYSAGPYRSSDHDPVLVGLNLAPVNVSPTVTITEPVESGTYNAGEPISLNADANDADGNIVKVDFYNNGQKFATDSTAPYGFASAGVEAANYILTAVAFDNDGDSTISDTVRITVSACTGSGNILGEGYTGIPGVFVSNLTGNPKFPNNPDLTVLVDRFEYRDVTDNYGGRLRGYICAPVTGYYRFFISGDEQSELWLSTNADPANKQKIAFLNSPVPFRSYGIYASQKSAPVLLLKGARYYIESLHKEAFGADHLSVAWQIPGGSFEGPIPGTRLSPWTDSSVLTTSFNSFHDAVKDASAIAKGLVVKATPNPSTSHFTIVTRSNSDKPLTLIVTDVLGRVLERRSNIAANGRIEIGNRLVAGTYFVEITQDGQKQKLKLVRQ